MIIESNTYSKISCGRIPEWKVRGSSIDHHSRSLRLIGENRYLVLPAIDGGEDAEEKIKARKRQLVNLKQGSEQDPVTRHVEEVKGESSAIIAKEHVLGDVPSRRLLCDLVGEGSGGFA